MGKGNNKYSQNPDVEVKSCKARGSDLRVHYKNTRETAMAIKGLTLPEAKTFLNDVLKHKRAVPFRRHTGNIGRHAQQKQHKFHNCRWPKKSCNFLLDLLQNAESNAEVKNLDIDNLVIKHIQVQRAAKQRRRTYRAHGRINPYMASPCHIEMFLIEDEEPVPKPSNSKAVATV
eukprot:TRINITY_DN56699_c0_g1_i1.p1 TRINITY_DN56699_c0_g1~~TRINITY_DN56699_c0_g1_i1.p1  ORF type:complete len:174 (-),score=30.27 TRINITY_DN56699_c0_g1_i1:96-617(-)